MNLVLPRSKGIPPWNSANMGRFLRSIKATLPLRQSFVFGQRITTTYDPKWDEYVEALREQEKLDRSLQKDYGAFS